MSIYWIIFIGFMLISMLISRTLTSRFEKYSKEPLRSGMTGKQIAEKMLNDNGIYDVKVVSTKGFLSDHYDPRNKTVNLSEAVYGHANVAAAAVAAHECGHAVQHETAYSWLTFRSVLVPVVQFGSRWSQWVLLAGLIMLGLSEAMASAGMVILLVGVGLFALSTLFAFITLPVEYNASSRALAWLNATGITQGAEHEHAQDALKWAARTYVVAALSSLATLLYYIAIILGRRD
ncbi:zinc metallopeptidase [Bacteroidales bacterium OttesenSCG-928-B11]|nr:zinc metallopeptidase [Bacteroidales bacterium OttesenSCG-928-E04]MDL2312375.1 zinc metallopeptidase [Bacteroidales bacterium OttesenSCG-928-B11]